MLIKVTLKTLILKVGNSLLVLMKLEGAALPALYTAAIILDYEKLYELDDKTRDLVRDSKKLSVKQRERILPVIKDIAITYAIQSASVKEVDELNIIGATFLAMNRSLASLERKPDITLVDGNQEVKGFKGKQRTLVKGDSLAYTIAAASILAKDARDSYILKLVNSIQSMDLNLTWDTERKNISMLWPNMVC